MGTPDPHFGSDEQMLAWCEEEGITPRKDADGAWDWQAAWEKWRARLDGGGEACGGNPSGAAAP